MKRFWKMPKKKLSWAAWNYNIDSSDSEPITLTYNMNILQNIKSQKDLLVTLNPKKPIQKENIIKERHKKRITFLKNVFIEKVIKNL